MALAPFNFEKTAQAAAAFLRRAVGHEMTRMRLLKLLAISDREAIRLGGRPITGDSHVAMRYGPVLSNTYSAICGKGKNAPEWERMFGGHSKNVTLLKDPGDGKLSNFELEILARVESNFRGFTTAQLSDYTHNAMADWVKYNPGKTGMNPIPDEDMLDAIGVSPERKKLLLEEAAKEKAAANAFSNSSR